MSIKVCVVENCNKEVRVGVLCDMHSKRRQRHGHLEQTRPDDWGVRTKHPLHNTWKALVQKQGDVVSERWHNFWLFVEDIGTRPSLQHKLKRVNDSLPYGPDNFEWRLFKASKFFPAPLKEQLAEYQRGRREKFKEVVFDAELSKRYGISAQEYMDAYVKQKGVCFICEQPETQRTNGGKGLRSLAVDHCHTTNKFRALLCANCNMGLGSFKDDPVLLKAAIKYLSLHSK